MSIIEIRAPFLIGCALVGLPDAAVFRDLDPFSVGRQLIVENTDVEIGAAQVYARFKANVCTPSRAIANAQRQCQTERTDCQITHVFPLFYVAQDQDCSRIVVCNIATAMPT